MGANDLLTIEEIKKVRDDIDEVIQVLYNRLDRSAEDEVFPICEQYNLGVLAY